VPTLLIVAGATAYQKSDTGIKVHVLVNSGEENPAFELTSRAELVELRRRLKDLPQSYPRADEMSRPAGYLLENHGVPGFPQQIEVSGGIVCIYLNGQRQYFSDAKKLQAWLDTRFQLAVRKERK